MAAASGRPSYAGTNIEHMGSGLDKQCREAAARCEPQWTNAGKTPGLQIWRIEKFVVKPWPPAQYGSFFSGDSYIVLHTYHKHAQTTALAWDIYFWLGQKSTQDEMGTAAYKTVELDDFLGGGPVQHREVQGFESQRFLSLFPGGFIQIMEGGVDSGFNHVKPEEYRPRLLHVKGVANNVRVEEVPKERASLNSGDVFLLDLGLKIFQWNGRQSSGVERLRAGQLLRALNDDRNGRPKVEILDEGELNAEFWAQLGGPGPVRSAVDGGSDAAHAAAAAPSATGTLKLFRLSDASGSMTFTKVGEAARFPVSVLDTHDVFILDAGDAVYAWVGKGATRNERREALGAAQRYLTDSHKPAYLPIERLVEGCENDEFQRYFDGWTTAAVAPDVQCTAAAFQSGLAAKLSDAPLDDKSWMNTGTCSSVAGHWYGYYGYYPAGMTMPGYQSTAGYGYGAMPYAGMMQQTPAYGAMPGMMHQTPAATGYAPMSGMMPQTPAGMPGMMPQTPAGMPGMMPQTPAGMPGMMQQTPGMPGMMQQTPAGYGGMMQQTPAGYGGMMQQTPTAAGYGGMMQQTPAGMMPQTPGYGAMPGMMHQTPGAGYGYPAGGYPTGY